jgi:hypothetical protein
MDHGSIQGQVQAEFERRGKPDPVRTVRRVIVWSVVAIVLAVVLYQWALSFVRHGKIEPEVELECHRTQHGDYVIEVVEHDPSGWQVDFFFFEIRDTGGDRIDGHHGYLKGIYSLDRNGGTHWNVTFYDTTLNGMLDEGDYLIVRSEENGGFVGEGYELLMRYSVTWDIIGRVKIGSLIAKEISYPVSEATVIYQLDEDLTAVPSSHTLSRWACFNGQGNAYTTTIEYSGSEPKNLSFSLYQDDYLIGSQFIRMDPDTTSTFTETFTVAMWDGTIQVEIQRLVVIITNVDTNWSLLEIEVELPVVSFWHQDPSFLHSPPLQLVTLIVVGMIALPSLRRKE